MNSLVVNTSFANEDLTYIHGVGGSLPLISKLDEVATYNWKFAIRMYLIHEGLWNCIVGDNIDPDQDQHILTKICLSIKPASYAYVRTATTVKEAWKSFQAIYEDKDLNRLGSWIANVDV